MVDPKVLEISQQLKFFYRIAFREENLDYFISLILSHYIAHSGQTDTESTKAAKNEMISLTDLSLYLVKLIQAIVVSDDEKFTTKYRSSFVLLILKFLANFCEIVKGFLDKDKKVNFKSQLLNKNLSKATGCSLKNLMITQGIFLDRVISHKDVIDAINEEFLELFGKGSAAQSQPDGGDEDYAGKVKSELVTNFSVF
jgi:hypothetical protein